MQKIISYPLSLVTCFMFLFLICLFHIIQFVSFNIFGYQAHKKSVDIMDLLLLRILLVNLSTAEIEIMADLPEDKPIIFVANHQGLYDIIGIGWFLRKYHPSLLVKLNWEKVFQAFRTT